MDIAVLKSAFVGKADVSFAEQHVRYESAAWQSPQAAENPHVNDQGMLEFGQRLPNRLSNARLFQGRFIDSPTSTAIGELSINYNCWD